MYGDLKLRPMRDDFGGLDPKLSSPLILHFPKALPFILMVCSPFYLHRSIVNGIVFLQQTLVFTPPTADLSEKQPGQGAVWKWWKQGASAAVEASVGYPQADDISIRFGCI